jgi:hypothetical protein
LAENEDYNTHSSRSIRALILTAKRAGLRRTYHRFRRYALLKLFNPLFAKQLYSAPELHTPLANLIGDQREILSAITFLCAQSPIAKGWDVERASLVFFNQPPFHSRSASIGIGGQLAICFGNSHCTDGTGAGWRWTRHNCSSLPSTIYSELNLLGSYSQEML